jgi:hypothetical protein
MGCRWRRAAVGERSDAPESRGVRSMGRVLDYLISATLPVQAEPEAEVRDQRPECRTTEAERTIADYADGAAPVGRASQKAKGKCQKSKCPTGCHSVRSMAAEPHEARNLDPSASLGQALSSRQTRFLVASLLGMTSLERRSCTLGCRWFGFGQGRSQRPECRTAEAETKPDSYLLPATSYLLLLTPNSPHGRGLTFRVNWLLFGR